MPIITSLTRSGQNNGSTADDRANFLELAAGEVQVAWEEAQVMKGLHTMRTITEGKSARFPIMGQGKSQYHKVGNDLFLDSNSDSKSELGTILHSEQIISIDDMLISNVFIPDIDELQLHYDVRGPYTTELGRQLAYAFDKATMRTVVAAARSTNPLSERPAGGAVLDADFLTNGASAVDTIYALAQKMDEAYIPTMGRHIIVTPGVYYNLVKQTDLVNKDITSGSNGDFAKGIVYECAGIKIHMSAHFALFVGYDESTTTANDSTFPGVSASHVQNDVFGGSGTGYGGNFASTAAICFHESAIGTVKLLDLKMESEYVINRQGTLMLAKYAMGHGILRPEAAFEVTIA